MRKIAIAIAAGLLLVATAGFAQFSGTLSFGKSGFERTLYLPERWTESAVPAAETLERLGISASTFKYNPWTEAAAPPNTSSGFFTFDVDTNEMLDWIPVSSVNPLSPDVVTPTLSDEELQTFRSLLGDYAQTFNPGRTTGVGQCIGINVPAPSFDEGFFGIGKKKSPADLAKEAFAQLKERTCALPILPEKVGFEISADVGVGAAVFVEYDVEELCNPESSATG